MKHYIISLLLISCSIAVFGQQDTLPPYRRVAGPPPLLLVQQDSSQLTAENIKKNHPLLLLYFSPSCEHCQHQINDMMKRIKDFKKYQIIMATYQPMEEIREFYKNYRIASYPNISVGRDTKFLLPPYFRIRNLPYMVLYDRKGHVITTFEGNVKIDKLLSAFNGNK